MTTILKDKDHYIAFRKQWTEAVNAKEAKKQFTPPVEFTTAGKRIPVSGRQRSDGWIGRHHMMFFNLVTGRPLLYGFTAGKDGKNTGAKGAASELLWIIEAAKKAVEMTEEQRKKYFMLGAF